MKGFKIDLINFKKVETAEPVSQAILNDERGKRRFITNNNSSLGAALSERRCLSSMNIDEQKNNIAQAGGGYRTK